jgi:hypothetical protein
MIGLEMAPHDARRPFAKLAHKGKVPIEQIQLALGQESIQTTERYLGVQREVTCHPFTRRVSAVFGLVSDAGWVSD